MHKRTLAFLFWKCLFLLKCFNKKVADKMRHLFFLTAETMIGILHHVPFTLFVEKMETLTISVWDNSVCITM